MVKKWGRDARKDCLGINLKSILLFCFLYFLLFLKVVFDFNSLKKTTSICSQVYVNASFNQIDWKLIEKMEYKDCQLPQKIIYMASSSYLCFWSLKMSPLTPTLIIQPLDLLFGNVWVKVWKRLTKNWSRKALIKIKRRHQNIMMATITYNGEHTFYGTFFPMSLNLNSPSEHRDLIDV
jgi:hypothetical protein